jgi:TPP-dependent pyruvate/acetoin dehydrogenase alpha subunit
LTEAQAAELEARVENDLVAAAEAALASPPADPERVMADTYA